MTIMPNNESSTATYTTLMRVTTEGRPYCQNLYDLFAALIIQHGLKDHRHLFRTIPNSFVLGEATEILGNLQFSHLVKKPDPLDPSHLITTRTTTTFSMSPHMAKTLGQNFLNSRLLENAIDSSNRVLKDKSILILTPKAKFAILGFCHRAGVSSKGVLPALSKIESFNIVTLERLSDHNDMIAFARPNMTMAFKTMMAYLPMESLMADDAGVLGIDTNQLEEYQYSFFGSQAFEWICEYTTVTTNEEAEMVASEFVLYGWISQVIDKSNRNHSSRDDSVLFKTSKNTMYYVTSRGREVLAWDRPNSNGDTSTSPSTTTNTIITYKVESHETILMRQRALAARLKSSSSKSTARYHSPPSTVKKTSVINEASLSTSPTSPTSPSISSNELSGDTEESSTVDGSEDPDIALQGVDLMEFDIPLEKDDTPPKAAATTDKPSQTDFDQTTEKLLLLRKVKQTPSHKAPHSTQQKQFANMVGGIDFITSAPIEGVMDLNSHWAKLRQILEDPLLRMYFRDFLKSHFSEENLNIWVDYYVLRKKLQRGQATHKELLQQAYAIYLSYLAPNAPSEVNIEHGLRQEIEHFVSESFRLCGEGGGTGQKDAAAGIVSANQVPFATNAFQPPSPQTIIIIRGNASQCLREFLRLYNRVNGHICHIMAQDSVPKFVKTEKYRDLTINPPKKAPSPVSCNQTLAPGAEIDLSDLKNDLPDSS